MIIAWFFWVRFPLFTAVLLDGYYLFDALGLMTKSIFFFFLFLFLYTFILYFLFCLENCQQLQKKRNKKEFQSSLLCFFGQRFLPFYYCFAAWIIVPI